MFRCLCLAVTLFATPVWADMAKRPTAFPPTRCIPDIIITGVVKKAQRFPKHHDVALLVVDDDRSGPGTVALVRGEDLLAITGQPTSRDAMAWLRRLVGKRVRVIGMIATHKSQLRIAITRREQLTVFE